MGEACSNVRGNLSERDHLEDLDIEGTLISKLIVKKWDGGGGAWTGLVWLSIGTGGELL